MFLKTSEEVKSYIDNLNLTENDTLMILVGEKSSNDLELIREYLNNKDIRFLVEYILDYWLKTSVWNMDLSYKDTSPFIYL